ncbi:TPA: hypothetical protein ACH3X1_011878 [Trebouxia sp. C0004]
MEPRCSRCGEQAVDCDGQSVCQGCGFVISEGYFVAETGAEGQQLGQHVNANGRVSGGSGRNGYHLGLVNRILPQQFPVSHLTCVYSTHWVVSQTLESLCKHCECTHACLQVKAYGEMTVLVNRVGCSNQIKQDALHYMESVYSALGGQGRMSLERMAAACLYLAVRLCKVPVSLEDISTPAGKYITGADCRKVSAALDKNMPPVNYDVHMQRNLPRLQPLYNSRKLADVLESFDKLQEWSYLSETLTVGDSSASKAAMLYLSAKAHQVKVTARTVAPIFDGVKEKTLSENARKIKIALAKGAQALPWLEDKVTVKNIVQNLDSALATSPPRRETAPRCLQMLENHSVQPQMVYDSMVASAGAESSDTPASSACSEQTECGSRPQVIARKRPRTDDKQIVFVDENNLEVWAPLAKHARFSPEDVDSACVDAAIPDHELGKYLFGNQGMALRGQTWQQHQASYP